MLVVPRQVNLTLAGIQMIFAFNSHFTITIFNPYGKFEINQPIVHNLQMKTLLDINNHEFDLDL